MKSRRDFFRMLQVAVVPVAPPVQRFGPVNTPRCPVCRAAIPSDAPSYAPIVRNDDGTWGALVNARQCACTSCGVMFVVSV